MEIDIVTQEIISKVKEIGVNEYKLRLLEELKTLKLPIEIHLNLLNLIVPDNK